MAVTENAHEMGIRKPGRWRLMHIISGLYTGGAENMLLKLLSITDRGEFEPIVLSLRDHGTMIGARIEELDVGVLELGMRGSLPTLDAIWRLRGIVRRVQPDLIQGWMYHGNLAAWLAAYLAPGKIPMVWNIRHTPYDLGKEKPATAYAIRVGARLSSTPRRIIYNAKASARQHEKLGYNPDRTVVVANGFDCDQFRPSPEARAELKRELGVPVGTMLIGLVARYHPMKDHANFIRAAGKVAAERANVRFVLVGEGLDPGNRELLEAIGRQDLDRRTHLLGERSDIPYITAGLDIATSSSSGEAFPNVIGEAMACGVPCVVTDVGDSSAIVGDTGIVVPPKDPAALAAGWLKILDLDQERRHCLGTAARKRVMENYSLASVARQYEAVYRAMLPAGHGEI